MIPPELGKPRVTEIQVRMDCNGCVQKIKKALHGINGIYDLYIDFPQQKLTIIGWADPEKIIKAVKKARRTAIICSHSEQPDPPTAQQPETTTPNQPTEPEAAKPPEQAPAPDGKTPPPPPPPPPAEAQASGAAPPAEPPKDPPPPTENPPPDVKPSAVANDTSARQPAQPSGKKDVVEEVRVIHYYPPDYGYRYNYGESYSHSYGGGQCNDNKNGPKNRLEPSPHAYATHSYNTQKPSASVTHSYITSKQAPYVREYEYIRSPPPQYTKYTTPERQSDDYQNSYNGKGNITSMFSEENPNACTIV